MARKKSVHFIFLLRHPHSTESEKRSPTHGTRAAARNSQPPPSSRTRARGGSKGSRAPPTAKFHSASPLPGAPAVCRLFAAVLRWGEARGGLSVRGRHGWGFCRSEHGFIFLSRSLLPLLKQLERKQSLRSSIGRGADGGILRLLFVVARKRCWWWWWVACSAASCCSCFWRCVCASKGSVVFFKLRGFRSR